MKVIQNHILALNFVKEKIIYTLMIGKHVGKHIDLQSQVIYVDKKFFKKSTHILEDGANNV